LGMADVEPIPAPPIQSLRKSLERFDLKPALHSSDGKRRAEQEQAQKHHAERLIRNEIIVKHVQSWMEHSSSQLSPLDILRLFECIERLVHLMDYSFSGIIWQMLCYAERYVHMTRPIRRSELFHLLVVSVCLAMKMWEDYGPDLELTAQVCGIPKKRISEIERTMLEKFDFKLNLDELDVEKFKTSVPRLTA